MQIVFKVLFNLVLMMLVVTVKGSSNIRSSAASLEHCRQKEESVVSQKAIDFLTR
jgi:hypothetical protein